MIVLLFLNAKLSWATDSDNRVQPALYELPSITAVLRKYANSNPDVYAESWVSISPQGMRVTNSDANAEIIKNFVSGKVWMVNRKHKSQHEIDVHDFKQRFPELFQYLVGPETRSNILGRTPCADWNKSLLGEMVWRGQIVQHWKCTESTGLFISHQYFSSRLGVVVRVKHADSTIDELRDINQREINASVFLPENKYRLVSLDEFFGFGAQLLSFSD